MSGRFQHVINLVRFFLDLSPPHFFLNTLFLTGKQKKYLS